jgi:hypothetical protein
MRIHGAEYFVNAETYLANFYSKLQFYNNFLVICRQWIDALLTKNLAIANFNIPDFEKLCIFLLTLTKNQYLRYLPANSNQFYL